MKAVFENKIHSAHSIELVVFYLCWTFGTPVHVSGTDPLPVWSVEWLCVDVYVIFMALLARRQAHEHPPQAPQIYGLRHNIIGDMITVPRNTVKADL